MTLLTAGIILTGSFLAGVAVCLLLNRFSHFINRDAVTECTLLIHPDPDPQTGSIAICAVRYCIGRQTDQPGMVMDWVKRHWHSFSRTDRAIIMCNVAYEIDRIPLLGSTQHLGSDFEAQAWTEFLYWMQLHADDPSSD